LFVRLRHARHNETRSAAPDKKACTGDAFYGVGCRAWWAFTLRRHRGLAKPQVRAAKEKSTTQGTEAHILSGRQWRLGLRLRRAREGESVSEATALIAEDDGGELLCVHRLDGKPLGCFARSLTPIVRRQLDRYRAALRTLDRTYR
jgi:hypothetical protein